MNEKKIFKVLCPIAMKDGGTYWMRCGNGFAEADGSMNLHLVAMPVAGLAKHDGIKLHLREYTEAERRERAEKRAMYQSRPTGPALPPGYASTPSYGASDASSPRANESIPF